MAALRETILPAGSLSPQKAETSYRQPKSLWLALEVLDPRPDSAALESLADFAQSLTPVVVFRPGEGLLLEVQEHKVKIHSTNKHPFARLPLALHALRLKSSQARTIGQQMISRVAMIECGEALPVGE